MSDAERAGDDSQPRRDARAAPDAAAIAQFAVPTWIHRVGGWQARHPKTAIRLGNFDTRMAGEAIADRTVVAPIYIAGLARSGTTKLLELIAGHTAVASHRYRDFPPIFTPWLWDRWLARVPRPDEAPAERAHGDGIRVTSESPEAFEEVLWMAFFDGLHDPSVSNRLDRDNGHPDFERFYEAHLRKVLAIRDATRYAAKGNYHLVRLAYLQRLHADARFVLAVRDPIWHIASLMKQQRLFEAGETAHPRALEHMRRVGHFEFGLDRRPINPGDTAAVERVQACWDNGREIEGWARYWALIYNTLADTLAADDSVRQASFVVPYEHLCRDAETTLRTLFLHCELEIAEADITAAAKDLHEPDYYRPAFDAEEIALVREIAGPVAARFGYDPDRLGEADPLRPT